MRRLAGRAVVLVAAAVTALGANSATASAGPPDRAAEIVASKTGKAARELPAVGERTKSGFALTPARVNGKAVRTFVQRNSDTEVRLMAELREGQREATFPDLVPEGMTIRLIGQGAEVLDLDGETVAAHVAPPWAIDANGRSLPTRYVVEGRSLRQVVDVEGAAYPIVVDPWVTFGWYYALPVYYNELSWSETWAVKLQLDKPISTAPSLLCMYLPTTTARFLCGAIFLAVYSDVKTTVNSAISNKRCYKLRTPATGSVVNLPLLAYDSYTVTCRK